MEHYYVVNGNEYGLDLTTKRNFSKYDYRKAIDHYEKVKNDDFSCVVVHVTPNGKENIIFKHLE